MAVWIVTWADDYNGSRLEGIVVFVLLREFVLQAIMHSGALPVWAWWC
jgi:hypothetical protein